MLAGCLWSLVLVWLAGGEPLHPLPPFFYTSTLHHHPTFLHPPPVYHTPTAFHPITYTGVEAMEVPVPKEDVLLCENEGFYPHPNNCSRFYRCVDFAGTRLLFSLYMFECPQHHVFSMNIPGCVPGTICPPLPIPSTSPDQPSTDPAQPSTDPAQPSTDPAQPSPDPAQPSTDPAQPSTDPTQPSTDPTLPSTDPAQPSTDPAQPSSTPSANDTTATADSCQNLTYLQQESYCNVYTPCNDTNVRYLCSPGTVFDQPNQMCRISAFDERLCAGKGILPGAFLRTELVDGHLLLPEGYVMPPLTPHRMIQPLSSYLPQSTPELIPMPQIAPQASPSFSPGVGPLVRTKVATSPSHVRRPQGHLQFPNLFPYQFPLATSPHHNPYLHYTPFNNLHY